MFKAIFELDQPTISESDYLELYLAELELTDELSELADIYKKYHQSLESYDRVFRLTEVITKYGINKSILEYADPENELFSGIIGLEDLSIDNVKVPEAALEKLMNNQVSWAKSIIRFFSELVQKIVSVIRRLSDMVKKYKAKLRALDKKLADLDFNPDRTGDIRIRTFSHKIFELFNKNMINLSDIINTKKMSPKDVLSEARKQMTKDYNRKNFLNFIEPLERYNSEFTILGYKVNKFELRLEKVEPIHEKAYKIMTIKDGNWDDRKCRDAISVTQKQLDNLDEADKVVNEAKETLEKLSNIIGEALKKDSIEIKLYHIIKDAKETTTSMSNLSFAYYGNIRKQTANVIRLANGILRCKK